MFSNRIQPGQVVVERNASHRQPASATYVYAANDLANAIRITRWGWVETSATRAECHVAPQQRARAQRVDHEERHAQPAHASFVSVRQQQREEGRARRTNQKGRLGWWGGIGRGWLHSGGRWWGWGRHQGWCRERRINLELFSTSAPRQRRCAPSATPAAAHARGVSRAPQLFCAPARAMLSATRCHATPRHQEMPAGF